MNKHLMWFRQDLRLSDNPALIKAVESGAVLPVYIADTSRPEQAQLGEAASWWLHHSLKSLSQQMENSLLVVKGDPAALLPKLAEQYGCSHISWNRCYQPWQIARDTQLKEQLKDTGYGVTTFNASLLWEPWQVLKKDGTPYRVFTPYYRKGCLNAPAPRMPVARPDGVDWVENDGGDGIDSLDLLPAIAWDSGLAESWKPGEEGAKQRLSVFLEGAVDDYQDARNIPSHAGTSRLSPHLKFGEISVNQVWYAALDSRHGDWSNGGLDCYLSELGWREFSYYLLYHFPAINVENFQQKFDQFPWLHDPQTLNLWQQGKTGYPIVDAGMRELYQTGYMHNRVRMIVGSFLVKNLLLDWRLGERWFWDTLVDADMASNSAGWQWVAGSGADASPYFRIFNPITQGEKFDKDGSYVKRYCPELAELPIKYIHKPFDAPADILDHCNVVLGDNYPKPLVELKASRERALAAFAVTKE